MNPTLIAVIVAAAFVAVLIVAIIVLYNGLVGRRNRCDNAWQTIDAQLQRRSDLIPNLVNTVKGYAAHEKSTLEEVTAARAAMAGARDPQDKMEANDFLTNALRQLFAVVEAYPNLKADANFRQLQADLTDTENRIVYARQSYNDVVFMYNTAIQTFPGVLLARMFHFEPRRGFEVASEEVRNAPDVQF